ncbi:MAG: 3-deoxy-7-phosphoheptulonate synthase, partial [Leucothrix sp.]
PRTSVGWKGLINDPDISGEYNINKGLRVARNLLLELSEKGMPAATEFLDLISPQYIADLISWGAIGARTTESQGHRELASGSSCPIGFKNGTYGNVDIAINAIKAAANPHHFLSVTKDGHSAIFTTAGNDDCHVILRGGLRPNYDSVSVEDASNDLRKHGLSSSLMVDFSHANSRKNHVNQKKVSTTVANQIANGSHDISGVMIESHLVEGNQKGEGVDKSTLTYGQSITDACIGWDDTITVLEQLAAAVETRRKL